MSRLAIDGGEPEVKGPLKRYNTIGAAERCAMEDVAFEACEGAPLSGFRAGIRLSTGRVRALELEWAQRAHAKHAIACNSATSGLLAACVAAGVGQTSLVTVSPYTMSATAAAPAFLGADLFFGDIDPNLFCLAEMGAPGAQADVIIATDLFGHPAPIVTDGKALSIIDASHAPFARNAVVGDIEVFSLNVHKHLQCGEGGICLTDDDELADKMRLFINHGEMAGKAVGLNLRMTEVSAAVAHAQLCRSEGLIASRIVIAESLTKSIVGISFLTPPAAAPGCRHVYYCWAAKVARNRDWFVDAMAAEGVPLFAGYTDMLYRRPAFQRFARPCPVAERVDDEIALFEVCAFDPTPYQLTQIGNAFQKVAEHMDADRRT